MRRRMNWDRTQGILVVVLLLIVGYLLVSHVSTRLEVNSAKEQAQAVADPVEQLCSQGGPVADALDQRGVCQRASEVQSAAAPPPVTETVEAPTARGVRSTDIRDGRLLITYTDGATQDKGRVVGVDGKPGEPGRGVVASDIVDGRLVLSYSDHTTEDVGPIVGPKGEPGRGIASSAIADGRLVLTYTDGTTEDLGPLPVGRGIRRTEVRDCRLYVTYTDGTTEDAGPTCTTETQTETETKTVTPTATTTSAGATPLLPTR